MRRRLCDAKPVTSRTNPTRVDAPRRQVSVQADSTTTKASKIPQTRA